MKEEGYSEKGTEYDIWIIKTFITIFLLWVLSLFIKWCFSAVYNDMQLDNAEGLVLNASHLISKGEPLYRQLNDYPFFICIYPPCYIWFNSLFINEDFSLIPGRLISICSLIVILIVVFKIGYHESKNIYLSFIASLLCIYFYPVFFWAPLYRNDLFGIAFSLLGLWSVIRYEGKAKFISILFFLIALYTKQTLIAGPIAAYGYLFFKNKKDAIFSITLISILGGIIFLLINLTTGNNFYYATLVYGKRAFSWARFFISWKQYALYFYPLFISLSILYITRNLKNIKKSPLLLYLFVSSVITVITGGVGVDLNFFIEFFIAVSITSALIISEMEKELKDKKGLILFFYLLLLFQCLSTGGRLYPVPPTSEQIAGDKMVVEIFHSHNGEILAENITDLLRGGKKISADLWEVHNIGKGYWNKELFMTDLKKGKFTIIQLPEGAENNYSEEFREILAEKYHIAYKFDGYHPYRGHIRNFIYVLNSK